MTEDHADTHPPCMCVVCFNGLRRKCQAVGSGADFMYSGGGCGSIVHWKSHSRLSCTFCSEFSRAGRPSKKKRTPSGFFKKFETHMPTNTDTTTCTPPHSTSHTVGSLTQLRQQILTPHVKTTQLCQQILTPHVQTTQLCQQILTPHVQPTNTDTTC